MKRSNLTIDMIREKIDELVGREIQMQVCRGRKQVFNYQGTIQSALPRVFVVKIANPGVNAPQLTYSYSDVLCGEVQVEAL